jgi:hypothetical protein
VATSELVGQQAGRECSNLEVMELEDLYKEACYNQVKQSTKLTS